MARRQPAHRLYCIALASLFAALLGARHLGAGGDVASFTYSKAPADVLLFVQSSGPATAEVRSMSLFGDGRVELAFKSDPLGPTARRDLRLSESEMESLLRGAVENGIAEWDATRIESEKLVASGGRLYASKDGAVVTVSIALTSLRRGGRETSDVHKTMQVPSPALAAEFFPEIEELSGIADLQRYMLDLFSRPASE